MKFISTVKLRYTVMAGRTPIEDAALTLFASGVADELDNLVSDPHESEEEDAEYYKELKEHIVQPRQDIVKRFEETSHDFHLDLKKYLPVELVGEMIKEWETKTGIKFADMPTKEQHRLPLSCIGYGVSPFDDGEEWIVKLGVDPKKAREGWRSGNHRYFENDHNAIWAWLSDAVNHLKEQE